MSLAGPLATTGSNRVVQHPYKNQKAKTAQCTEVEILLPISNGFGLVSQEIFDFDIVKIWIVNP